MYRRKLISFALISLGMVIAAAVSVLWSSRLTQNHILQMNIADTLLSEHLQLSSTSYRLFKQLTDEILLGKSANQAQVRNKRAAISESLGKIRLLEEQQRQALGAEYTRGTVEDTDDLEELIDKVITDFEAIAASGAHSDDTEQMRFVLEERIDIAFREAINSAVERQAGVVQAMNNRIDTTHTAIFWLSLLLATIAILLTVIGCTSLIRAVTQPVKSLTQGAERIAKGELDHRVQRGFDTEFDEIAKAFNFMADQLKEQYSAKEQARQQLEFKVSQRTAELTAANQALEKSAHTRRNFLADVSHELRTPLTIIRGEAQVTLRKTDRDVEEYRDALQCILEQSISLGRLVEDMLFIARADANNLRIERQRVDLAELLEEGCRDVHKLALSQHIDVQLQADLPDMLLVADAERLRQLLLILLENALRYSPSNTTVLVNAKPDADKVHISVQDQGFGIDEQELPYIFERFYRGSGRAVQGMGLGLAVAKAIVTAHGGQITASSLVGKGTTMSVWLPRDPLCVS
ncbi:sensor histidine kinase [Bowmanella denitrificans]|uniref:sensor histidine kinase n=1 Tax=Bowmanella denitrificans TaxID=366582 RepID=UPI000C99996C|nr:ATP-binding protein [Bowmanella denitrificans]